MGEKIKTKEEKDLGTYLRQSLNNNSPKILAEIFEAKQKGMMLVLEMSDLGTTRESFQTIGMIVKFAAMQGVEVRIAADDDLEEEEK